MRGAEPVQSLLEIATRDHDLLQGLADDDHAQYLNVARHDLTARHPWDTVLPPPDARTAAFWRVSLASPFWECSHWIPANMLNWQINNGGMVQFYDQYVRCITSLIENSWARVYKSVSGRGNDNTWDATFPWSNRDFHVGIFKQEYVGDRLWIVTGSIANPLDTVNINRHIGFLFESGNLYASCGNGAGQTTTLLPAVPNPVCLWLRCIKLPSGRIDYYVDGVLRASHNTNQPTGNIDSQLALNMSVADPVGGVQPYIDLWSIKFLQY